MGWPPTPTATPLPSLPRLTPRLTPRLPTLATMPPAPPLLLSLNTKLVTTITRATKDDRLLINQDAISNLRPPTNLPKWAGKKAREERTGADYTFGCVTHRTVLDDVQQLRVSLCLI